MKSFNIDEAKFQFPELVEQAAAGEEIIIAKDGKPMAKLIPLKKKPPVRRFGFMEGKIQFPDDPEAEAKIDADIGALFNNSSREPK